VSRDLDELVAFNEGVAREVNEAIERGHWPGEEDARTAFRCECAKVDCNLLIEMTPREYEDIRSNGRRFAVAPGHELPEFERIVTQAAGYVVVEKLDEAGDVAEETDPRG
jgi:hypothetical protein